MSPAAPLLLLSMNTMFGSMAEAHAGCSAWLMLGAYCMVNTNTGEHVFAEEVRFLSGVAASRSHRFADN